jgi:hypothetical protein
LRSTADNLADVSERVQKVMSKLQVRLDGEGPAWGNDSAGKSFADGGSGYLAQVDWVTKSIHAKTDLLNNYSTSMHTTANTLQGQDETSSLRAPNGP